MFGFGSKAKRAREELERAREERRKRRAELRAQREQRRAYRALQAEQRVKASGHRAYVGGHDSEQWYGIGKLQYHFLVSQGLLPEHRFLDIACGSLRLGQYLIPYLHSGHYYGIEGEASLVDAGLKHELLFDVAAQRMPQFAINYEFDFGFLPAFDYAIAQSLFTHLTPDDIRLCLRRLRPKAGKTSRFFFTFFLGDSKHNKAMDSHANVNWRYSVAEMEGFVTSEGWSFNYIGDWNHPRDQKMAEARLA